jgi:hypothetical protein
MAGKKTWTGGVIAKVWNGREEAQKAQEEAVFPNLLRLLRLFAASAPIGSGDAPFPGRERRRVWL